MKFEDGGSPTNKQGISGIESPLEKLKVFDIDITNSYPKTLGGPMVEIGIDQVVAAIAHELYLIADTCDKKTGESIVSGVRDYGEDAQPMTLRLMEIVDNVSIPSEFARVLVDAYSSDQTPRNYKRDIALRETYAQHLHHEMYEVDDRLGFALGLYHDLVSPLTSKDAIFDLIIKVPRMLSGPIYRLVKRNVARNIANEMIISFLAENEAKNPGGYIPYTGMAALYEYYNYADRADLYGTNRIFSERKPHIMDRLTCDIALKIIESVRNPQNKDNPFESVGEIAKLVYSSLAISIVLH